MALVEISEDQVVISAAEYRRLLAIDYRLQSRSIGDDGEPRAIAAERERCAAIADRFKTETETPFARGQQSAAFNIALAIRVPEQAKWAAAADAERAHRILET